MSPARPADEESLRRFELLFEHAPFSVQLLAADGRTLRVNRAWEALWQLTDGDGVKEYVLGEYNVLADPQLEARGVAPHLRRAFAGESVEVPAIRYDPAELGKAGRARWVRAFAHPVKDAGGAVREVMLIHEDVTDKLRTEQELRGSELRLKQLANTIPQLAWMADPQGWIHWYNDRWYDYTGTTPQEMEGWGWQSVHDPEGLPKVVELWKRSIETGEPFQMTFPLRGRDGTFRPFFTLVAPLKDADGRVVQWFGTNTDVSRLQEAQESMRMAEERLRLAMLAGNIGIWEWDTQSDIVTWSDQVYVLHGVQPGKFGGTSGAFAALVHPEDRPTLWSKLQSSLAADGDFTADFRVVLPDGEPRWLTTWARVHGGAGGTGRRMIGATISIDAYKKAEAALRESDRRKDEFLAMLAHELRNPLAPISTAAQLIRMDVGDAARVGKASEVISRQMQHITKLVDDLLDVSRVTRGLIQLERESVELSSVIHSAAEQALPLIEARGHAFATALAPNASVLGDRARLVQVFANLLNNAARYTPRGGRIELSLGSIEGSAVVRVADNGQGIDAALLPHVFDLFTQGARTPDRSQGGLGIGLALVRRLVELHGGQVVAQSAGAGRGSVFTVTLPLVKPAPKGVETSNALDARDAHLRRIMVVDDNRDAADSLASLLGAAGHAVEVQYDARGALDSPALERIDAFILDIGLPDMDGYALARSLRERNGSAAFVALTGYGQPLDPAQTRAAGFDHHFVKPVDLARLAHALQGS